VGKTKSKVKRKKQRLLAKAVLNGTANSKKIEGRKRVNGDKD
jgi:hypothetical protein